MPKDTELNIKLDAVLNAIARIATPIPAIPAVPAIPAIPAIVNSGDHDLIIRLGEKIDSLKADIQELKNGTSAKIEDHEVRIRINETFKDTLIGKMAMIGFGSSIIVSLIFIGIQYFLSK